MSKLIDSGLFWDKYSDELEMGVTDNSEAVSNAIDATPAAQLPRWIPVAERLPEPLTDVLVWIDSKDDGESYADTAFRLSFQEKWSWADHSITHWMPMPGPPVKPERTGQLDYWDAAGGHE